MQKSVILLSGGLDSSCLAYVMARRGVALIGLSFDYGQRHRKELEAAQRISLKLGLVEHQIVSFDLAAWKGSPLTGGGDLPKGRSDQAMAGGVAPTYVPARNTIFLAFALGLAETRGCDSILIGAHADDRAGYPDCRDEFFTAFEEVTRQGTRHGVETGHPILIKRPFIAWKKHAIVAVGVDNGIDFGDTWTCYSGEDEACATCDSCRQRLAAFAHAKVADPLKYRGL